MHLMCSQIIFATFWSQPNIQKKTAVTQYRALFVSPDRDLLCEETSVGSNYHTTVQHNSGQMSPIGTRFSPNRPRWAQMYATFALHYSVQHLLPPLRPTYLRWTTKLHLTRFSSNTKGPLPNTCQDNWLACSLPSSLDVLHRHTTSIFIYSPPIHCS